MKIDLWEIYNDLIDLCEDNENMKEAIKEYFTELEESSKFSIVDKNLNE